MSTLSKDQIKDRLLQRAAKHWGYNDVELEHVFDPIVSLLFDVCAKELEKISNEVHSSRRRMTERLVEILTPSISTKASPARAIMSAYPSENEAILSKFHQFYYQKKETNINNPIENNLKNYFFGPTLPIKLTRNKIQYVLQPEGLYQNQDEQYKAVTLANNFQQKLPHSTIWLAIKHEGDNILKDLMFYFYFKKIENRDIFYHFLPKTSWYINDKKLNISKGYNTSDCFYTEKERDLTNQNFYHLEKIEDQVNQFYENNFITVNDTIELEDSSFAIPEEFSAILPDNELKKLQQEKLVWIKIKFSNVINDDYLSNIYCANNCFPIVNKKLNTTHSNINDALNIFPLHYENNESFLEMFSVTDDKNNEFDVVTSNEEQEETNDFVFLRYGGVARFDQRNASEEIHYLLDLIRDEAAAFSRLGTDFTTNNLKEINQIIARFRNKVQEIGDINHTKPYLVFETKNKNAKGTLFSKYWTTTGIAGNKINAFSKLGLYKGADFESGSMLLLTTTQGGRNELSNQEKIYAYRENLISNQRVVTRQDIIILCKKHFGGAIKNITIENGIQNSLESHIGYTPTIDIVLKKNTDFEYTEDEWEFLKQELKVKIESRAVTIVPFRIFFT